MNSKMKMIVGIALVVGVLSAAFLAAPIQAYVNGTADGDLLQTQDQDRQRTQDRDCTCDSTCTQYCNRQRTNECATNRICNCTMNMEQHRNLERCRNQNRERTRSLGSWRVCACYARHRITPSLVMPSTKPPLFLFCWRTTENVLRWLVFVLNGSW